MARVTILTEGDEYEVQTSNLNVTELTKKLWRVSFPDEDDFPEVVEDASSTAYKDWEIVVTTGDTTISGSMHNVQGRMITFYSSSN